MRAVRDEQADRRGAAIAAAVTVVLLVLGTWLAFAKDTPFSERFEVRAQVATGNQLREGDPVRIAGVDVGRVASLDAGPGGSTVLTLRLDEPGRVRADASLSIAPRLLLEGNNYVDLRPGTPGAPAIASGATIPLARTATPVQLDQVLSTLDRPVREALRSSVRELGDGLGPGTGAPPEGSGADGMRRAARELDASLGSIARVAEATGGRRPGDLRRAVGSSGDVAAQLAADPRALADAVTGMRQVFGALADQDRALAASVREIDGLVRAAPRRLRSLDAGLPQLDRLVSLARPSLRRAPRALDATASLMDEIGALVGPAELPALLRRLDPVTAALPGMQRGLREALPYVTSVSECVTRNIVPSFSKVVPDGRLSTGRPAWQDMLHMAAALTGTSPGFDGNGGTLRLGIAEGPGAIRATLPGVGPLMASANLEGVNPAWLGYGATPQFRPDAPCTEQALPDLAARSRPGLPAGFTRVKDPAESAAARRRRGTILQRLFGSEADRARLRRMLLDELPRLRRRPKAEAVRPVRRPAPKLVPRAPGSAPARPKPPVEVPLLEAPLRGLDEAVDRLLDPDPRGSGLGRLLGGLGGSREGGR